MSDPAREESASTLRDRVSGGRPMIWVLVEGNRLLLAGGFLAVTYALVVGFSVVGPGSVAKLADGDPLVALFSSLVVVILIGVTLVLTFNQLVLSRELGPVGDHREQLDESLRFREDVAAAIGAATSPAEPSAFLLRIVTATGELGRELEAEFDRANGPDDVRSYAETVADDADRIGSSLAGREFGTFRVIRSALEFDYSAKTYRGRELRARYDDALSPDALDTFDELLELLELFGPTREHFKTLYFQWEIIDLSRVLVYLSVPALAAVTYALLVFRPPAVGGATLGIDNGLLVVTGLFVVGVSPFAVFLSYMLRIVSVAKWTLAIGPFILHETDTEPVVDGE